MYGLSRNGLLHEGVNSEYIKFEGNKIGENEEGQLCFPPSMVWGVALMLSYLSCYNKACPRNYALTFNKKSVKTDVFWGNEEALVSLISGSFGTANSAKKPLKGARNLFLFA